LHQSIGGKGGVGTYNAPDTVYSPAIVCLASADVSTRDSSAVLTYDVEARSAYAVPAHNMPRISTIRLIKLPSVRKRIPQTARYISIRPYAKTPSNQDVRILSLTYTLISIEKSKSYNNKKIQG
jgi:hypothetical protein